MFSSKLITKSTASFSDSINKLREAIGSADDKFVEDEGWQLACDRYKLFLHNNIDKRILFLELGVGYNTPVIIKYPFWQMTRNNAKATYACINFAEAVCPEEIEKQSILINGDIDYALRSL